MNLAEKPLMSSVAVHREEGKQSAAMSFVSRLSLTRMAMWSV